MWHQFSQQNQTVILNRWCQKWTSMKKLFLLSVWTKQSEQILHWVHTFATSHITFSACGHWAPLGKCRVVWVLLLGNCLYWLLCLPVLEGAPQCSVLLGKLAPNWSCARPIKDSNTLNPASLATLPFPPDCCCYCGKFLYAQLCIHTVDLFAGLQTLILKLKLSVSFLLLLEFCFLWYVALWRVCTSNVCK